MEKKKFCNYCDSKGVRHKKGCEYFLKNQGKTLQQSPVNVSLKKDELEDWSSVSKNEFDGFKKEVQETQNKMLEILEGMQKPKDEMIVPAVEENTSSPLQQEQSGFQAKKVIDINANLNQEIEANFLKHFDPEDGFGASLEGTTFQIFVPEKFSNRTDGHKKLYTNGDFRTKVLSPHNLKQGVADWCALVAKNIHYNKNLRTK